MFDNLFGLAGPVGTAFVLVAVLFGVALFSLGGMTQALSNNGRARV